MTKCPDPTANPDYCETCNGWGHLCSAWRKSRTPEHIAEVKAVYVAGFDPTRFYSSTAACRAGEFANRATTKGESVSSYILRKIDPELWQQVKSEAALEPISIRELIERLLKEWIQQRKRT